jgi:hypothetical protein
VFSFLSPFHIFISFPSSSPILFPLLYFNYSILSPPSSDPDLCYVEAVKLHLWLSDDTVSNIKLPYVRVYVRDNYMFF